MQGIPEVDYRAYRVLFVDDEPDILASFRLTFRDDFTIECAGSGAAGLEILAREPVAVVVADQRMPGMSGLEFLQRTMESRPELVRIVLTGYADIDSLIEAINSSRIYRYVTKPWDPKELGVTLRRAIEAYRLERENARLLEELRTANAELARANERLAGENSYLRKRDARDFPPSGIVGTSEAMREIYSLLDKIARSPTTVLILGETGTGKELIARALHDKSARRDKLFVAVNCAALSESLLESELFGHRRGAFTGAVADKKGLFDVAHGGTLFLDEIGETAPAMQAKLLRVLQEGEITPVGDTRPHRVDVRVVAATNRNLEEEVRAGRFRQDLYYRVRVVPIRVPSLRERLEDVPDLVRHFVGKHAGRLGRPAPPLDPAVISLLMRYSYPGNVRELENEIERAVLLTDPGDEVTPAVLSELFSADGGDGPGVPLARTDGLEVEAGGHLRGATDAFERSQIVAALERNEGRKARAAREIGITYQGLVKKMRRLGMMD